MATTQTDLRALRRGPQTTSPNTQPPPSSAGSTTVIARPRARWATRLLIPAAVLLATGGLLAYAARDALRPRLAVHVAAAIPKETVQAAGTSAAPGSPSDPEAPPHDAPLGPAIVQAPGWIEPAPFAVSVPALAEGVVRDVLVLEGERIEAGQAVAHLIDEDARLSLRAAEATVAERDTDVARARAALATAESQVEVERSAAAELRDEVASKRGLVAAGGLSEGAFRREVQAEPNLPRLVCNAIGFKAVLLNLMVNAREAMPDGGTILLAARVLVPDGAPAVEIVVADDGHGMTRETLENAFIPLFTTRSSGVGGYGLSAAKNFVQAAGGHIKVESEPTVGTRVIIVLPAYGIS